MFLVSAAVVLIAIVAVVGYLVVGRAPARQIASHTGPSQAIRVTSDKLISQPGSTDPKAVLSLYEDFLCPVCGRFEQTFGPTVSQLIDSGKVAADYYPVAILDSPAYQDYSSRAGAAAHCAADESIGAFRRFHAALFQVGTQPSETGSTFPDNAALTQLARQAGAAGGVATCITSGKYRSTVKNAAATSQVSATPTLRINGEDYEPSTPEALQGKIEALLRTSNL